MALVYSNYFGWALVGLLMLDLAVHDLPSFLSRWKRHVGGGLLLLVAYAPMLTAFHGEVQRGIHPRHSLLATAVIGAYNLYCIFVSESVAPWYWALGVPAGLAVAVCLAAMLRLTPRPAKRFLLYFGSLLAVMTILGIVDPKRPLFVAPWLILPLAVTLGTVPKASAWRRVSLLSLVVAGAIGWCGIFARTLYAAPHWVEPWNLLQKLVTTPSANNSLP